MDIGISDLAGESRKMQTKLREARRARKAARACSRVNEGKNLTASALRADPSHCRSVATCKLASEYTCRVRRLYVVTSSSRSQSDIRWKKSGVRFSEQSFNARLMHRQDSCEQRYLHWHVNRSFSSILLFDLQASYSHTVQMFYYIFVKSDSFLFEALNIFYDEDVKNLTL